MKKHILVDMDGVLADIYPHFIAMEYRETGIQLDISKLDGILEEEAFPSFNKVVNTPGFFRTVPVIPDSIDGLRYLNDKYEVTIVSSATEFPNSLIDKHAWLSEHFPFISWKQIIFCGNKQHIQGDIMIDDHPKNLLYFNGKKILFTEPHNTLINNKDFIRVHNWKDIMQML